MNKVFLVDDDKKIFQNCNEVLHNKGTPMHRKIRLAIILGFFCSAIGIFIYIHRLHETLIQNAIEEKSTKFLSYSWSSYKKDWSEFANWLHSGGRRSVINEAFAVAKNGLSEDEIYTTFGPPDWVLIGDQELQKFPKIKSQDMNSKAAYIYKIGGLAQSGDNTIVNERLIIIFDATGHVISCLGQDVLASDANKDIAVDTRSDKRFNAT